MHLVGRRSLLRGVALGAGAPLLGSMIRQLTPEALGQPSTDKRLVLWHNLNSVISTQFPQAAPDGSLMLPTGFAPFAGYRNEITVVHPLYNPYGVDLHGNFFPLSVSDKPGGDVSLDRFVARAIGAKDVKPSLNLAPLWHKKHTGASLDGPNQIFPVERSAVVAYENVFAQAANAQDGGAERRLRLRKSLLDHLTGDVTRLNGRLAGPERAKLDQMLTSLRSMEERLSSVASTSCTQAPMAPSASLRMPPVHATVENFTAHEDVAINALGCGLTHVVTMSVAENYFDSGVYPFLGEDGLVGHHDMWHATGTPEKHRKYYAFQAERVDRMRTRLAQFTTGGGSVAANTLFVLFNSAGTQHHNGTDTLFVILVGTLGGAIKSGGKLIKLEPRTRCLADAFVSIANAVGVPITRFGGPACQGPLPGIT